MAKKKSQEVVELEFINKNYKLIEEYKGANIKHKAIHIPCGSEQLVIPSSLARKNVLCTNCNVKRRVWTTESINEKLSSHNLLLTSTFKTIKSKYEVKNLICEHTYPIDLNHFIYDNTIPKCPICTNSIKNIFFSILKELTLLEEYKTSQTPILVKNTCNHEYYITPLNLVYADSGRICRICNPIQESKAELEVYTFISNLTTNIIRNDRTLLEGKEIDIYLPDLKLGIEYNGIYYHNEVNHKLKTDLALSKGIQLIHINEDEWLFKQELVKSRLKNFFNKNHTIPARKCTIKQIEFPEHFLNENHMQGAGVYTSINYGLFYDELVAVMTFKKARFNPNYEYELVRFCSLSGINIQGGASKLLKVFETTYNPKSIISYSDRRWGTGTLYKKLNFTFSHTTTPNYKYYKNYSSLSRYQCQKHLLKNKFPLFYKEELTEKEIMKNAGYTIMYDSGNDVFIKKFLT